MEEVLKTITFYSEFRTKKVRITVYYLTYVTIRDTRHARHATRAYFYFYARHENQKNYDTRHATRDTRVCFFYARHDNKKNYDTRHATRDTSVYLTMGHTVTSAIFRITKCLF